jgi:hypothetical protein
MALGKDKIPGPTTVRFWDEVTFFVVADRIFVNAGSSGDFSCFVGYHIFIFIFFIL